MRRSNIDEKIVLHQSYFSADFAVVKSPIIPIFVELTTSFKSVSHLPRPHQTKLTIFKRTIKKNPSIKREAIEKGGKMRLLFFILLLAIGYISFDVAMLHVGGCTLIRDGNIKTTIFHPDMIY